MCVHGWHALWTRAQGYYYQSFSYCWLAWQHVSKPHGRMLKCIVCREDGQLVMIWPLETVKRALWTYLVPLGPEGGDYTSVLVADDASAPALIEGAWNTLFGVKPNRSDPFVPLMLPVCCGVPKVLPVATAAGGVKPLVTAVYRNPEYMLTIGAMVQPFRIAFAVSLKPVKFVL